MHPESETPFQGKAASVHGWIREWRAGERIGRRIMIPQTIRRLNKKCKFAAQRLNLLHNREVASSGDRTGRDFFVLQRD